MEIGDLERNDLAAVAEFYAEHGPELTADTYNILWRLQDDPTEFERMSEEWKVLPTHGGNPRRETPA